MHYILYLSLSGVYAKWLGSVDRSGAALAVYRNRFVIDADESARRLGVRPGLALTEAKAMVSGVEFREWNQDDDPGLRDSWLEGMLEFTDRIEVGEPHEAYLDLTGHPDPLSIVPSCLAKAKHPLVAGLGAAKWIARAAVFAPQPLSQDHVVLPERSLKPLPIGLLPIPPDVIERLGFLGYSTIGDVQKAPREVLVKQFGDIGLTIESSARGGSIDPVRTNYPPGTISVRVYMESPWNDSELRDADLRTLASRMGRALVDQDRSARTLQLILVDEAGSHELRERTFSKPLRTGAQVFGALRGLAEEAFPAIEARARLSGLEKAPSRQFELARARVSASSEVLTDTVERVRTKFGSNAVVSGCEVKLPRRKVVLRAWCDATGWL